MYYVLYTIYYILYTTYYILHTVPPLAEEFAEFAACLQHCPANGGAGYSWLANSTIVPAIAKLL